MEEDKELELSLGLACRLTPSASNDKSGNSSDDKTDADERTSKILNDFRSFLNAGVPKSFPRTNFVKPGKNSFNHIQQTASAEDDSTNETGVGDNKRKNPFGEMNNTKYPKQQETESRSSDLQEIEMNSHISITTDEGSTDDDEDVAESEAEASTSRIFAHHDDGSASSSLVPKKVTDELTNVGASSVYVTMSTSSLPYSITIKESGSTSAPNASTYPMSLQNIQLTNGNHTLPRAASTKSVPMTLAHSSVQILDEGNHWGIARPPSVYYPYADRSTPTSVSMPVSNITYEASQNDARPLQQLRGSPELGGQDGSPSQPEIDATHAGTRPNSFPSEYPAIKPGIAAKVNFGGTGLCPNLPWVSATGPGPNGKTISGVTYKCNATQIKIVCACHGVHLSPDEFVLHAAGDLPSAVTDLQPPA